MIIHLRHDVLVHVQEWFNVGKLNKQLVVHLPSAPPACIAERQWACEVLPVQLCSSEHAHQPNTLLANRVEGWLHKTLPNVVHSVRKAHEIQHIGKKSRSLSMADRVDRGPIVH